MCVFFFSLHLMHGMDVLDYREASDSSHITLILSVRAYKSAFYSIGDGSTGLFFPPHKAIYKLQSNRERHIISWK